jgi:MFS family permease
MPVAHKPGAIPLRPLVLSDIFDGAFRIIRYNPKATIGAAVLVSAVAMTVPIAAGLLSGSTGGLQPDPNTDTLTDSQVLSLLIALGGLLVGAQLQSIGLLFVSGMIAHVSSAAAVGRKLTMTEAWAATRGKRWRLLGMSFMLGFAVVLAVGIAVGVLVVGIVVFDAPLGAAVVVGVGLAAILGVLLIWFWVRVRALAVPTLMLEPVAIFGALRRAVRLTSHQFWRLLGLLLLVTLVTGVAGGILRLPFSITGQVFLASADETGYGLVIYLLMTAIGTVISSAVLQPFSAAVSALLYIDQRMRKEAYDVELLTRAGILPA